MNKEMESSVMLIDVINNAVKKIIDGRENDSKEFISDEELRERLGVSRTTLYNWRLNKSIPYKRIGKKLFYPWKEILKLFKA